MRLGGRLAAAIEVLEDMERRHRPAADALKDWGLSHRFAGAGDRAAIGNIVYDALRRRRSAGWLLGAETPRAVAFGGMILGSGRSAQEINAALEGDKFAPEPLSSDDLAAVASRDLADAPEAVRADVPDWCVPMLEQAFGDDWVEEAKGLAARPPLDLRANTLLASRDKVIGELPGASATAIAPHGIRIPPIEGDGRHPNVQVEPAFQKGWFEIQDEGSQVAAWLSGAAPGMQVLDLCAGAGGKTLALAATMDNRGQIFAHDSEKARLAPIFDRLKRAECRNVQVIANPQGLADLEGRMDIVLIDAPCTGSGTWRRRPDAKWRLTERQLDVRLREQAAILDNAARYVKPGGSIAYVTCSVFPRENQDQVAAFLDRHPDFSTVDHAALWAGMFPAHPDKARTGKHGIVLTPLRSGTDGFFFASMRRAG
ncbi:MAG: RsmB/NOP family class I SAM-dependent RNA methyltransferase [Pseudomonadota bacterium]